MKRFAVYGKGGSGKSMIASNLSVQFSRNNLRTLQIGCDPKHDSTRALMGGRRVATVMDVVQTVEDLKKGTVSPAEGGDSDVLLIERQGGSYAMLGVDISLAAVVTPELSVTGSYSWTSKDSISPNSTRKPRILT